MPPRLGDARILSRRGEDARPSGRGASSSVGPGTRAGTATVPARCPASTARPADSPRYCHRSLHRPRCAVRPKYKLYNVPLRAVLWGPKKHRRPAGSTHIHSHTHPSGSKQRGPIIRCEELRTKMGGLSQYSAFRGQFGPRATTYPARPSRLARLNKHPTNPEVSSALPTRNAVSRDMCSIILCLHILLTKRSLLTGFLPLPLGASVLWQINPKGNHQPLIQPDPPITTRPAGGTTHHISLTFSSTYNRVKRGSMVSSARARAMAGAKAIASAEGAVRGHVPCLSGGRKPLPFLAACGCCEERLGSASLT